MSRLKTIVFLDVDGVLSLPPEPMREPEQLVPDGLWCWPVANYREFLQVLDSERAFLPLWLTAWGDCAQQWNSAAGTSPWPCVYGLKARQGAIARRVLPDEYAGPRESDWALDAKRLCVRYYLRNRPRNPVIWIEDGFAERSRRWACLRGNVSLIDTTEPALLEGLRTIGAGELLRRMGIA